MEGERGREDVTSRLTPTIPHTPHPSLHLALAMCGEDGPFLCRIGPDRQAGRPAKDTRIGTTT